ncbi:MAG TPA: hypothetical protein VN838_21800 [Bradyrhizobium sp.]|nr:hypothetical protein [Bradyrhizobium sp.]
MIERSVVFMGGPDSGKTNYFGRLWATLRAGDGTLVATEAPREIKYVEGILAHLLQGQFAPRSDKTLEEGQDLSISAKFAGDNESFQITMPDVSGELWKRLVETGELPQQWVNDLKSAAGALVFVRVGSDLNVAPLDWVTAAGFLRLRRAAGVGAEAEPYKIPTQVFLCELLRFIEYRLGETDGASRQRVAVVVTAWDKLDAVRAAEGPSAYLAAEFPLLAGRLADISRFDVRVFGISVVGGDFIDEEFKQRFFESTLKLSGYVVTEDEGRVEQKLDLALPLSWVVKG